MDQEDLQMIDAIASQQMGAAPQQAAPPAEQQAQITPPAAKPAATPQEQATAAVAPKDNKNQADAFEFLEVELGNGRKQAYSPDQLRGIASRYSDLNYRHQTEVAPIQSSVKFLNSLREQAAAEGTPIDDAQLAQMVEAALTAYAHNPTIGNNPQPQGQTQPNDPSRTNIPVQTQTGTTNGSDFDQQLAQWEQENAVKLPPAYKDAIGKTAGLESKIAELTNLVQQLAQSGSNISKTAEDQLNSAKTQRADAGKQQLINNLQQIQMKHQLADDAEQDFMDFVQGRGYDVWELLDMGLADKLAGDFKAVQQSPELDRFRQMAQRRQAYTGNLSPTPGGNGSTPPPAANPDMDLINSVTDDVMKKRNMV